MSHPALPQPVANADSQPYWDAAREQQLLIRKCSDCDQLHFMPRHLCPHCWSDRLEWVRASGRGSVHSLTVIRRASDPAFAALVPYAVALVDLDEGPRMFTNIVGGDALAVQIGDRVQVVFEDRGGGSMVPQFKRMDAGTQGMK